MPVPCTLYGVPCTIYPLPSTHYPVAYLCVCYRIYVCLLAAKLRCSVCVYAWMFRFMFHVVVYLFRSHIFQCAVASICSKMYSTEYLCIWYRVYVCLKLHCCVCMYACMCTCMYIALLCMCVGWNFRKPIVVSVIDELLLTQRFISRHYQRHGTHKLRNIDPIFSGFFFLVHN
jgi:hypothetical protein